MTIFSTLVRLQCPRLRMKYDVRYGSKADLRGAASDCRFLIDTRHGGTI